MDLPRLVVQWVRLGLLGLLGLQVQQDPRETWVQQAQTEQQAPKETQGHRDLQDLAERSGLLALMERRAQQATQDLPVLTAPLVLSATPVLMEPQAQPAPKATPETQDLQEQTDLLGSQEPQETQALQAQRGKRGLLVQRVRKA